MARQRFAFIFTAIREPNYIYFSRINTPISKQKKYQKKKYERVLLNVYLSHRQFCIAISANRFFFLFSYLLFKVFFFPPSRLCFYLKRLLFFFTCSSECRDIFISSKFVHTYRTIYSLYPSLSQRKHTDFACACILDKLFSELFSLIPRIHSVCISNSTP